MLDFDVESVFEEVVTNVQNHFFDPQFDTEVWKATAGKYRESVINSSTRDEFSFHINQMLGTLNTSHTAYFAKSNPKRYQIMGVFQQSLESDAQDLFVYEGIGVSTVVKENRVLVESVYDGFPASLAGLKFGDQIVSIDSKPFHPVDSFVGKSGERVSIEIQRDGVRSKLDVEVTRLDGRTMFMEALESSVRIVERNGKRVGYLHVWSYAGAKYQEMIRSTLLWGKLKDCDSVVLDLRDGWGGADVNYLNLFREPIVQVVSTSRAGHVQNYTGTWGKPIALVTNGRSTSGKEMFTFGFKKLGLGKVFGERTAGAVVAGRFNLLSNGDVLYLAVTDIRVDGNRIEGVGVEPDMVVERSLVDPPKLDAQVEKAVEYLSKLN